MILYHYGYSTTWAQKSGKVYLSFDNKSGLQFHLSYPILLTSQKTVAAGPLVIIIFAFFRLDPLLAPQSSGFYRSTKIWLNISFSTERLPLADIANVYNIHRCLGDDS